MYYSGERTASDAVGRIITWENVMSYLVRKKPALHPGRLSYALAAEEHRCAPRFDLKISALMRFSGSRRFAVEVTEMSLAGFSCDALIQSQPGTLCWLTLPGLESLEAMVVHCFNTGTGFAFANLLDPAVLDHFIAAYPVVR